MLKEILLSCMVFLFTIGLYAQQDVKSADMAQVAADHLAEKYQLDRKQSAEMLKIQTRKVRNEGEIASLKETDLPTYLKKVEALETGTNFSIRKMLTAEQRKIYDKAKHELRTKRAKLANQMHKEGKLPTEIKQATLEIKE